MFKWTLEIEVTSDMVADGFDISAMVERNDGDGHSLADIGDAANSWPGDTASVTVISSPDANAIRREQGYAV